MKFFVRFLVCAAMLALPTLGTAAPASALMADLTCPVTVTVAINPGLSLLPQPQTATAVFRLGTQVSSATPCTSLTGVPYHGAIGSATGSGSMGCVGGTASGTATATWDNGDTSTGTWSITAVPPVPAANATLTAGGLTGSTVLALGVPTGFTGNCLLAPLTSLSGVGIMEFFNL